MAKSLITMFLIFGLILGINVGFTHLINKKFRFLTKCISIAISLCNIALLLYAPFDHIYDSPTIVNIGLEYVFETIGKVWFSISVVHLILCLIVLSISKYSLYNFLTDLNRINKGYNLIEDERVGTYTLLYTFGVFAIKMCLFLMDCYGENYAGCDGYFMVTFVIYYTPFLGLDAMLVEMFLIYYYLYRCVKCLKICLENSEICVATAQERYMAIADSFDKIRPHLDKMMLIEVLVDLPKLLGSLWTTLLYIKYEISYLYYIGDYVHAVHMLLQLFLPTLAADLVCSQVERIKVTLHDQLLRERDEDVATLNLLRYLSARPLSHQLCRVVPVNLRLLFALLNLCAGYFIVLIQFTHVYD